PQEHAPRLVAGGVVDLGPRVGEPLEAERARVVVVRYEARDAAVDAVDPPGAPAELAGLDLVVVRLRVPELEFASVNRVDEPGDQPSPHGLRHSPGGERRASWPGS